jgi:dTDP-4-dehydrorhamnose reductase
MEVWATFRSEPDEYRQFSPIFQKKALSNICVDKIIGFEKILDRIQPNVVINCIGIIKQRDEAKHAIPSIQVNSLFPHKLSKLCNERNIRLLQISTDCVFSGLKGQYRETDIPDPVDLYGRTKLLGELDNTGSLTLRTSIIGWQLNTFSSLLSWFYQQRGKQIKGYHRAVYTGFSTRVLAELIGDIIETRPELSGLYHVASKPISKYDLLVSLREKLMWDDIKIARDDDFFCDRSLIGTRFNAEMEWTPPEWEEMLSGLAKEWPNYEKWYKQNIES